MSLKLATEHPCGLPAPDAVWVIGTPILRWPGSLAVPLHAYANAEAYADGKPLFAERVSTLSLVPLIQGLVASGAEDEQAISDALHDALLALPEWEGAERVETTPPA